jgi:hypothetical protein
MLNNIVQHVNQDILIQPNFSSEIDAKLADKIDIKAFVSLQCFAGALRSNKQKNCGVLTEMDLRNFA